MTQRLRTGTPAASQSHYQFSWEQTARQRVFKLSGIIDATAATHLESAIINLGSRRLVVDISEVTDLHPDAAAMLVQIVQRVGAGRVSVVVDSGDQQGLVLTDVSDLGTVQLPA